MHALPTHSARILLEASHALVILDTLVHLTMVLCPVKEYYQKMSQFYRLNTGSPAEGLLIYFF